MKQIGIPIPGFRFDKAGRLVKDVRRLDVSARLRQKASKRVRVARKGAARR
jgi:hypothetical protein